MMKRIDDEIIIKYLYKEHYIIEFHITKCEKDNTETIEAWLHHKDYGIKSLMFGIPYNSNEEEMLSLVKQNIDEYIKIYKYDYED